MNKVKAILDELRKRMSDKPFLIEQDILNTLEQILTEQLGEEKYTQSACDYPDLLYDPDKEG